MGGESAAAKKERLEREAREAEEKAERERRERIHNEKMDQINSFKNSQDIGTFLRLIDKFISNSDNLYAIETIKALNENTIRYDYPRIEQASKNNINIIKKCVFEEFKEQSEDFLRKLLIILMFYERGYDTYGLNDICEKCTDEGLKIVFFNILLDYGETFGDNIIFRNDFQKYKNFALYALNHNKFSDSLNYYKNKIWQLKMVNDLRTIIFKNYYYKIYFFRLDSYKGAKETIQDLIYFEKKTYNHKISFEQTFWEHYYEQIFNEYHPNIKYRIKNLLSIYDLYVLYTDVGGESKYKKILASKIHNYVISKIKDTNESRTQIELLLEYDPYYLYGGYERDPDIFRFINILNMYKRQIDRDYFLNKDFENIYKSLYIEYIKIIVSNYVRNAQDLNIILELIQINSSENQKKYIELLINKYDNFNKEKLTCESFMNLFKKINEYYIDKNIYFLDKILKKFEQQYQIYLDILGAYDKNSKIMEKIGYYSYDILKVDNLIKLIKNIKENEKKNIFFDNLGIAIIEY